MSPRIEWRMPLQYKRYFPNRSFFFFFPNRSFLSRAQLAVVRSFNQIKSTFYDYCIILLSLKLTYTFCLIWVWKKFRSLSSEFGWEQNKSYFCISRCFLFYLKMFRAWILMVCFGKIDIFYWFFSLLTNNSLLSLKGKYRMLSNILMDIDFKQLEVRTTVKSIYYLVEFDRKQINWMRLNLNFSCCFQIPNLRNSKLADKI